MYLYGLLTRKPPLLCELTELLPPGSNHRWMVELREMVKSRVLAFWHGSPHGFLDVVRGLRPDPISATQCNIGDPTRQQAPRQAWAAGWFGGGRIDLLGHTSNARAGRVCITYLFLALSYLIGARLPLCCSYA